MLQSDILELLLSEHLFGFLASSDEIRHHCLCRPIWEVLVHFQVLVLGQLYSELITEPFKLGKSHLTIVNFELSNLVLGNFNAINIVRSHKKEGVLSQVIHYELQIIVVAFVGFLY